MAEVEFATTGWPKSSSQHKAASAARTKHKMQLGDESNYRIHILPVFGNRRITAITSIEIEAWLAGMQTKVSERTK